MTRARSRLFLQSLFVFSGATSLVYEILWMRGFSIVLGSTVYAMSCVLTAFMLGLTIGSAAAARALRRRGDRSPGVYLAAYGVLELAIGLYGLAFTPTLFLGQDAYLSFLGTFETESTSGTLAVHFAFSFVLTMVPTIAMGATLPVLSMSLSADEDTSALYGANTLGAAAGSVAASFLLIYFLGCLGATWTVAGINGAIFVVSLAVARRWRERPAATARPEAAAADGAGWSPALLLGLAFFSGYVFFSYELVWDRCLGLVLGNRVYVTSITLAAVLACLALGARYSRRFMAAHPPDRILFGCYSVAVLAISIAVLTGPAALSSEPRRPEILALFLLALLPVPALAMGIVLPLILSLPARGARGTHVGRLYAANTLGSVLGALLTGYVLISELGSTRILIVHAALLVGCLAVVSATRRGAAGFLRPAPLAAALAIAAAGALRWNDRLSVVPPEGRLFIDEDEHGIFTIREVEGKYLSVRCNSTELVYLFGRPETQYVQETQAHFPALFAPSLERTLVIGSGYGITAGALARWPVGEVHAVEILPLLVEKAEYFRRGNHDYLANPRLRMFVTDGRHFLARAEAPYDLVSINVSDPYLPGSASLFSTEFYRLVRSRLSPGAVVCQHVFGPDAATLYHGFKANFPHVRVVPAYGNGASLVGSLEPLELRNLALLDDHAEVREMLAAIGLKGVAAIREALARGDEIQAGFEAVRPAFTNSDVHPVLEFRRSPEVDLLHSNY